MRHNPFRFLIAMTLMAVFLCCMPTRAVAQEPTPTKLSITLATDSPEWRFTPAVTYDVVTILNVLGFKGVNAYVLGIGAIDAVSGNPTGGFALAFKPKVATNAFLVIGPKLFLDTQGRFSAGIVAGFEILKF